MNFEDLFRRRSLSFFFFISTSLILIVVFIYNIIPIRISNGLSQNEVIITYADNISQAHQKVVDNFNKEYEGKIRVKTINLPFTKFSTNERKELLTRSLRSKSPKLDVFAIDLIWSAKFAKWSESLNKYLTNIDELNLLPIAKESCIIDSKLIALPMYLDVSLMYYRKDLINKLPNSDKIVEQLKNSLTWNEFFELSKYFNKSKNPYYIFPADNYEGLVCSFIEILMNQNGNFFKQERINWDAPEIYYSFSLLSDMLNKYKITPSIVTDYRENSCYDYFINNNGVFLRGWASFPKESKALLDATFDKNLIEQVPLPHLKGTTPGSTIGGWNIMLSKYSEHKNESVEFIKYIVKEESQRIYYKYGAYLPVIASFYEDEEFLKKHPNLIKNKKILDSGIHRPLLDNYTKISDVISYYTNLVLKGKLDVSSAVKLTQRSLISGELILR